MYMLLLTIYIQLDFESFFLILKEDLLWGKEQYLNTVFLCTINIILRLNILLYDNGLKKTRFLVSNTSICAGKKNPEIIET